MAINKPSKILFFVAAIGVVIGALVFRLADLQILRGERFRAEADSNRFFTENLAGERGILLDRYNQPLVINIPEYYEILDISALYSQRRPISQGESLILMATDSAKVSYEIRRKYMHPEVLAHTLGYVGAVTAEELNQNSNLKRTDVVGKLGLEKVFDEQLRGISGSRIYEINALGQKQRILGEQPQTSGLAIQFCTMLL